MKKMMKTAMAVMAAVAFVAGTVAVAQDGLNGELDDLLGLSDEPAAPAAAAPAEEKAAEAKEEAAPAAEAKEEAVEEAAPAAEVKEEAVAPAAEAKEEAKDAVEDLLAPVEEKAEEAKEEAPAAEEKAEETKEEAPAADANKDEEDLAELLGEAKPAEAAPAAEAKEEAKDAVDDLLAPAEEKAEEAKEEAAAPAADAKEEAKDDVNDLLAPVEEKPAEAAKEPAAALDDALAPVEEAAPAEAVEAAPAEVVEEAVETAAPEAAPAEAPAVETAEAPSAEAAPAAQPGNEVDALAADISEIETLELMRRQALDEHGKKSLASAREEMKNGNYVEAQRLFEEADKFIARREGNEEFVAAALAGIGEAIYRQAEVLYKRGDYEGAIKLARQAREHNHRKAADLIGRIQYDIDNPPEEKPAREVKRWSDRDYRKNREQIKVRLGRARQYMITGEYDKARTELELVLRNNPYEHDAMILLKRISDRTFDANSLEFGATRASMIEQVRETWTPSYRYAINVSDLESAAGKGVEGENVNVAGKTPEEETGDKMRKIIVPEINFKNASISDVIQFFVEASREFDDPQIPPEQRGVNLILKIAQSAPAEEAIEEENIFAAPTTSNDSGVPPITFSARFMSLWDGLQYACELSRLKFRLRGNTVIIMPLNEADREMVSRTYTVLPSIEERASSMSSALSSRSTDSEGRSIFEQSDDAGASAGGVDWKQLFEEMGVKWPNGSSVKYLPSINKMRVVNTPENLLEFEKALQDLNVTPRQVEIEARFVEVAQTDLESLGFEWLLTDNWEIAKNKKDGGQYIRVNQGSGTAYANRYLNSEVSGTSLGNGISIPAVNDAVLSVSSVLTNPELGFVLHMLAQQANTDLLSAPKVVTMNGEEAIIKVVREYIYPTEYEIKENDLDSGDSDTIQVSYPSVEPQNFEMREVGVILQVVPQVSEDGQMISLQLNPQIISDPEWKDYGFDYPIRLSGEKADTLHLTMEQPIFKVRSVSTKISIYNGATVVMGGMITEERNEVNDKVPFLGDIPLLGRLFRSTYECSEKRNLLIFVTARMVDPAGRTLKTNVSEETPAASSAK